MKSAARWFQTGTLERGPDQAQGPPLETPKDRERRERERGQAGPQREGGLDRGDGKGKNENGKSGERGGKQKQPKHESSRL